MADTFLDSFATALDLSPDEAQEVLGIYLDHLREQIVDSGVATIPGFGTLSVMDNDLVFTADDITQLAVNGDFAGLQAISPDGHEDTPVSAADLFAPPEPSTRKRDLSWSNQEDPEKVADDPVEPSSDEVEEAVFDLIEEEPDLADEGSWGESIAAGTEPPSAEDEIDLPDPEDLPSPIPLSTALDEMEDASAPSVADPEDDLPSQESETEASAQDDDPDAPTSFFQDWSQDDFTSSDSDDPFADTEEDPELLHPALDTQGDPRSDEDLDPDEVYSEEQDADEGDSEDLPPMEAAAAFALPLEDEGESLMDADPSGAPGTAADPIPEEEPAEAIAEEPVASDPEPESIGEPTAAEPPVSEVDEPNFFDDESSETPVAEEPLPTSDAASIVDDEEEATETDRITDDPDDAVSDYAPEEKPSEAIEEEPVTSDPETESEPEPVLVTTEAPAAQPVTAAAPSETDASRMRDRRDSERSLWPYLLGVAALILIVALGGLYMNRTPSTDSTPPPTTTTPPPPDPTTEPPSPVDEPLTGEASPAPGEQTDAPSNDSVATPDAVPQETAPSEPETEPVVTAGPPVPGEYVLVVASWAEQDEAEAAAERFRSQLNNDPDLPVWIVSTTTSSGTRNRVTVGRFTSRDEALNVLENRQASLPEGTWLLRVPSN